MRNTPWQQITLGQIYRATINTLERWRTTIRNKAESFIQTTIEPAWEAVKSFGDDPRPLLPPAKLQLMPAQEQHTTHQPTTHLLPSQLEVTQPNKTYWWLPFLRKSFIPTTETEKPKKRTNPKPGKKNWRDAHKTEADRQKVIDETPLPFNPNIPSTKSLKLSALRRRRVVFSLLYAAWTQNHIRTYRELAQFVKQESGKTCSFNLIRDFKRLIENVQYQN